MDSRVPSFTELFQDSCAKVVTSCQDGDITRRHDTGGRSLYREIFEDKNFILKHTPDQTQTAPSLSPALPRLSVNGKRVVSGTVKEDVSIVEDVERLGFRNMRSKKI